MLVLQGSPRSAATIPTRVPVETEAHDGALVACSVPGKQVRPFFQAEVQLRLLLRQSRVNLSHGNWGDFSVVGVASRHLHLRQLGVLRSFRERCVMARILLRPRSRQSQLVRGMKHLTYRWLGC